MMCSKFFDTQKVREIGWKEAGESRGFPILWMGIIEDVFLLEGKECKVQERLKMCRRKSTQVLYHGIGNFFWASLVEKQKSGISGNWHRLKPTPWRGTVGEIRRGGRQGRRANNRVKKRVYRFRVSFG